MLLALDILYFNMLLISARPKPHILFLVNYSAKIFLVDTIRIIVGRS